VAPRTGQLDQISQAIGRIEGKVEGIEQYNHEREHGIRDMTQAVNGVGALVSREVAKLKVEIKVEFDAYRKSNDARVEALERQAAREEGAKSVVVWFLQSPLIGWIAAAVLFFIGWWKSR
jgi:methyl-accepting chemotaxis protein